MTDTEWADENPAPSKKLVPTWLWFCGGGCLLAVILAVVGGMWAMTKIEVYTDEDVQYDNLANEIAFDERPAEWDFLMYMPFPEGMWTFTDSRGYMIMIMQVSEGDAEDTREQMFNPDFDGSVGGMGGRKDAEFAEVMIQGREIDMMTYYSSGPGQSGGSSGQAASLDITAPGDDGLLMMMIIRLSGSEKITVEDAAEVLAPFHIGPDR